MAYGEYNFDYDLMREITGVDELVYIFKGETKYVTEQTLAVMNKYFCENPCDHVMHAHSQ